MMVLQCLLQVCQIPMLCIPGRVIECASDCLYLVVTPTGMLRRSRSYLNIRTDEQIDAPATQGNVPPRIPIAIRLRTGTAIKSPKKLIFQEGRCSA